MFDLKGDLDALYRPYIHLPWRTGRRVGQCIHALVGEVPSENDVLLFHCPSQQIARIVVDEHNDRLEGR